MNPQQHATEAESLLHWSMTAKPPCGAAGSPWQSQWFSSPKDVANKWEGNSPTSAQQQLCAKWSVFPVNLLFLNPVKLRPLPETSPSDLQHNTKFKRHHASVSLCNVKRKQAKTKPGILLPKPFCKMGYLHLCSLSFSSTEIC